MQKDTGSMGSLRITSFFAEVDIFSMKLKIVLISLHLRN
jgi:hypothetical protein